MFPFLSSLFRSPVLCFRVCAAAGAVLLLDPSMGAASIVYSNPADIAIPANVNGVYLDLETGALSSEGGSWDLNFFYGGAAIAQSTTLSFAGESDTIRNSTVYNLAYGSIVDGSSTFFSGYSGTDEHMGTGGLPLFENNVPGYLGFAMDTAGGSVYGWMQVTLRDDGGAGTIHAWAWEDSGGGISVGAVPQPGISFVTGFVLFSSLVLRRKRRAARA